jgi:hypothetical protein
MGESGLGAELLATDDPLRIQEIAARLDQLNAERQAMERGTLDAALRAVEQQVRDDLPVLVAAGEGWHAGILGIVAARLAERFARPTVVVGLDCRIGKGSGRSRPGYDLGAAVIAARQAGILEEGGGHPMAAGLTIEAGKLPALAGLPLGAGDGPRLHARSGRASASTGRSARVPSRSSSRPSSRGSPLRRRPCRATLRPGGGTRHAGQAGGPWPCLLPAGWSGRAGRSRHHLRAADSGLDQPSSPATPSASPAASAATIGRPGTRRLRDRRRGTFGLMGERMWGGRSFPRPTGPFKAELVKDDGGIWSMKEYLDACLQRQPKVPGKRGEDHPFLQIKVVNRILHHSILEVRSEGSRSPHRLLCSA